MPNIDDLLDKRPLRVAIVGGGIGGLIAARELARPGFEVTLYEASERCGGSVAPINIAGIVADAGAESFATRGGHVAELLTELHLDGDVVSPNSAGAWLQLPDRAVPTPKAGLLGIPSSPLAADVVAAIGWPGALRAYFDRLTPFLKIGQEDNLGRLVQRRMGRAVLDTLVAPVTTGIYSADPWQIDLRVAAPGLSAAMTRNGTLSGAVAELRAGGASKAGSAALGINGGINRIPAALAADAKARGAVIRTSTRVSAIRRVAPQDATGTAMNGTGGTAGTSATVGTDTRARTASRRIPAKYLLTVANTLGASPASPTSSTTTSTSASTAWPSSSSVTLTTNVVEADVVFIAVPSSAALPLLAGLSPALAEVAALDWPDATSVELVTLVLDAPVLDTFPRGTGLLVSDRVDTKHILAKAMTHATAKWAWLREKLPQGRHIVRLSYGRAGKPDPTSALDDASLKARALRDASTLLGVALSEQQLRDFARVRWTNAQPLAGRGELDRLAALRGAVDAMPGLEVGGAWVAGTGLASVIPQAKEAAARLRAIRWRQLAGEENTEPA